MYILIDKEKLTIVHRHHNRATLSFLAHIEVAHTGTVVLNERGSFDYFSLSDLYAIYKNTVGEWKHGTHAVLSEALSEVCESIPPSDVQPFEVMTQAMSIPMNDDTHYRYRKGYGTPLKSGELPVLSKVGQLSRSVVPPPVTTPAQVAVKASPQQAAEAGPKYPPPWA